ncbi:MAG: preprotein translocase subunit SecA [Candidatus Magasanikbacteria bacterium RIFOXYD2_FULL_39_9]|uniref:Protein translocase subunit SecA n=1 Tax=Candidatus Magasanikbacteria bacterium RIFOXYD1_FULL_40_23 TaxID=1798705 RepID=A0A1F6PB95_9BACT|nr:MAG: preprotein translocase subunit SecA [Candidatus Magasanikbacteria bacterium RIFOXYD2_FULL_39_9]OGH93429.1 MAG: preprotein translocase subunit SecA [Candidatus Magasanikbacteria bacterium RIFOXYD1_FULL_40_23]
MSFFTKIFGDPNAKVITSIQPAVAEINALEPEMEKLTLADLRAKTDEFKGRLANGETLDDILPEAFAVVRETSKRITGMRHFDVQLIGGIVLHRGSIAEMGTGEGKTLVGTLPTYLNALAGKGVHVVTVNDYLAKRDAVWMAQIYDALGLTVGIIQQQLFSFKYNAQKSIKPEENLSEGSEADKERDAKGMYKVETEFLEPCSRPEAYACDITYGTNNEFGFDYLRDNMVQSKREMSQRPFFYAIVDEVDSILIDEARTPLIISAPAEDATSMYYKFAELVSRLKENEDYNVDEKMRSSTLTEAGLNKMEKWLGVENIYAEGEITMVHHVEQALRAHALFLLDRDYIVENGEVMIVDEFTGRKMPGRRYSEGLHQAIEAKEGVAIQQESRTMATVTFQNYFRLYPKLSGMTGTAVTEAEEFGKIYKLEVVVIPPNKLNQRRNHPDRIYKTEEAKYKAIALTVKELQAKGQPVLIGTVAVDKNEALSLYLEREGIKHEILNAKNHEREGEIVAQAGRVGAVTLATNMAGRGVDILLGGNPIVPEEAEKVRAAGGLFVIGTERHESRRIDNQLRGRSGRQGDPGESQFYLSTDDDLMRIFAGDRIRSVMETLKVPDDMPIEQGMITRILESAQRKVEGMHFDTRKHLLEYDDVLNRHREVIYGKRREVLEAFENEKTNSVPEGAKTMRQMILAMVEQEIEQVVSFHTNSESRHDWNVKEILETVATIFALTDEEKNSITDLSSGEHGQKLADVESRTKIVEYLVDLANQKYEKLLVRAVPDQAILLEIEKQVLLRAMDNLWVDHLVAVDYLRTGIGLRGYGQHDPLVEYKKETFRMFNELLSLIQKEVVYLIYKVNLGIQLAPSVMGKSKNLQFKGASDAIDGEIEVSSGNHKEKDADGKEIGRNDACPCGSGKKYKKCHGA